MRKLRLELEQLVVDSFDPVPARAPVRRGTVRGRAETFEAVNTCGYCDPQETPAYQSCYDSDCGCPTQGCGSAACATAACPSAACATATCRGNETCVDFCMVGP